MTSSEKVMTVARTVEQLRRAARETEQALDALDPAEVSAQGANASDLRRLGRAVVASAEAEAEVAEAVEAARANGRSWGQIATMLGVTRQSARERFSATHTRYGGEAGPAPRSPADDAIETSERSSS